jgi:hypothetical protein
MLLDSWFLLSKLHKKVFSYLLYLRKKFPHVFPSKDRIAAAIKGSVKTVSNALTLFKQLGLLSWQNRGHRSNVYFLPDEFLQLEPQKIDDFLLSFQANCRSNCRLVEENKNIYNHVHREAPSEPVSPSANVPSSSMKKKGPMSYEELAHNLKQPFMKAFDFLRFGWLLKALTEKDAYEIMNDVKWYYHQKGHRKPLEGPESLCKIFTSMVKKRIFTSKYA